jgi:hypothetical protein
MKDYLWASRLWELSLLILQVMLLFSIMSISVYLVL